MTNKDMFKGTTYSSLEEQVGGKHYKIFAYNQQSLLMKTNLLFAEGNAIKYICRHSVKGKQQDIEKAIHF